MDETGDKLPDMMIRNANGRFTATEALGNFEFIMTRI
jgi:hypothetical protein